jgi:predicted ATP-grasp superfamily ATP-dependent carboligase
LRLEIKRGHIGTLNMSKPYGVLLLSGYNVRALVAFCRFARQNHLPFHLWAKSSADLIFRTEYRQNVWAIRESVDLRIDALLGVLADLRRSLNYEGLFIVPSTEYFNRFLLKHRKELECAGHIVPLVGVACYEAISDKYKFRTLCKKHGLLVPREFNAMPEGPPFVAKPRKYFSGDGAPLKPVIFRTHADMDRRMADIANPEDYYFQEYVTGESHYLLAHISKAGKATTYAQKNLMQQQGGGSIILARESDIHETRTAEQYIEMLISIGFHGLIMIEFKKNGDQMFMIEANPRLWGPLQFTLDAGIQILPSYMRDYGFDTMTHSSPVRTPIYYYWSGGLSATGAPYMYHDYCADQFIADYPCFRTSDLFLREDTLELFRYEHNETIGGATNSK